MKQAGLLFACSVLASCLAYASTLKMEATLSSEISYEFNKTTGIYIPENTTLLRNFSSSN
jgi:hypothetical protein